MKQPTIDELIGKVIEERNGDRFLVAGEPGNVIGFSSEFYVEISRNFNEDLTHSYSSERDIMKVFDVRRRKFPECITTVCICTWEREEVKEMTVSDIEKELGYRVKIVKETEV